MGKYNVGLKTLKIGDFSATTGATSNFVELEVYRDTLQITREAPTKQRHYQAGKKDPRKTHIVNGMKMAKFSVMDTDPDTLQKLLGGTVTTVDGKKKWSEAKDVDATIIAAMEAVTLDDSKIVITKGAWSCVENFNLTETGIALIDIEVEVQETGFPLIPNFTVEDL